MLKPIEKGLPDGLLNYERPLTLSNNIITPREFEKSFSKTTRFSEADVVYLMHSLKAYLMEELKNGNIVQTGVLGTFSPIVNKPKQNSKTGSQNYIPVPKIMYRPSKEMREEMKAAELRKVE